MRVELHPCYVLHARPWREGASLLELLSARHGRVGVLARGATARAGRAFEPLEAAWSGRGELPTATAIEPCGALPRPAGERLLAGLYVNELAVRLTGRHVPSTELWLAYDAAIRALLGEAPLEWTLRRFELGILGALGYAPECHIDAETGEPIEAGRLYHYVADEGPLRTAPEGRPCVPVHGRTLLELAHGAAISEGTTAEAKRLLRHLIEGQLGRAPAARALFARL